MEKLIYPRKYFRSVSLGSSEFEEQDSSDEIEKYKTGDEMTFEIAAPGTGRRVYRITHIDVQGIWGNLIEDSSREFFPEEVI